MVGSEFGVVPVLLVFGIGFVVSPLSNVLNVITVPLGYEWQSCPNCPEVGISKITYEESDSSGT